MTYVIEFDYQTGDSFHTYEEYNVLLTDFEWENLEVAKENLQRVKEHYSWYKDYKRFYNINRTTPPKWLNLKNNDTFGSFSENLITLS